MKVRDNQKQTLELLNGQNFFLESTVRDARSKGENHSKELRKWTGIGKEWQSWHLKKEQNIYDSMEITKRRNFAVEK